MKKSYLFSLAVFAVAWMTGFSAWAQDAPEQDSDGWYLLGSVDDVEWFGQQVMDGKHATIKGKLTADIDYEGVENRHRPIGHYGQKFVGKFDGQGHRILNMVLNDPTLPKGNDDGTGFFGCLRVGGDGFIMGSDTEKETNDLVEIKNLIIDASCTITSSRANTAGLVGRISEKTTNNTVLIENCINEATIVTTANAPAGIVGQINNAADGNVIIRNCVNKGTVTTSGLAAAGIISQVNNCAVKLNIESCMNLADVKSTGNKNCGGIHGTNTSSKGIIKINNCGNVGDVTGTDESAAFTGWIGSNGGNEIRNCWNIGSVNGVKGSDNSYRGTVTVSNIFDKNGGQGTVITDEMLSSGELCFKLNGDQSVISWYQDLSEDEMPMPIAKEDAIVYEVGDFYCDGTPKGSVAYSNTASSSRDAHTTDAETGFCTTCGNVDESWLTTEADGFYHFSTVNQVEWFSAMVAAGHGAMKVKLDADIDFKGVVNAHTPIGTVDKKFFGVFDGQKHSIKGMVLNLEKDGVGFFGHIQAGGKYNGDDYSETAFTNVIIDSSCSVNSTGARCGGLIGRLNGALNNDAILRIEDCGNEANVTAGGQNAGGLVGGIQSTTCKVIVRNCYNTGNITAGMEAAALVGWTGSATGGNVIVERCWNNGLVSPLDNDGRNLYRSSGAITASCLYDLSETPNATQGRVVINTTNPYTSGELCYLLNGDQSVITWTQNLDEEDMPNMYGTTSQVYQAGTKDCSGAAVGGINYNNVSGETIQLDHQISDEIGMCSVCHTQFQAPELVDGWYELKNAGNVEWFGQQIASGNLTLNAKLMNDIDFLSIENLHSPIGPNAANKFNGTFDGQGYRIKNMIIERPTEDNIGFFGWLRGNNANTTVKNLIIDESCSIHAHNRVGGLTGTYQNGGNTITIENVINEATVTAEHQDAGGIFGGHEAGNPTIIIRNVMNTGVITAKNEHPYAGALCCYMGVGEGSLIENFVNLGTVNGHEGGNIGRHNIGNVKNLIDLSDTDPDGSVNGHNDGFDSGLEKADIANGKLAYTVGWGQFIGIDKIPSPFNETKVNYVGEAGYATFFDATTGYVPNGDVKANVAVLNKTWLDLTEIEVVPAETPVILKGTYYNMIAKKVPAINIANDLKGAAEDVEAAGKYVLAKPEGEAVGFYKAATGIIKAGKAYIALNANTGPLVKAFYFEGEDATGIANVNVNDNQTSIYNIAGQRVSKLQKGINIVGGKKVLF